MKLLLCRVSQLRECEENSDIYVRKPTHVPEGETNRANTEKTGQQPLNTELLDRTGAD